MPNLKVNDFVELVKRSGLVESSRLEKVLSELEQEQPLNESGIVCSGLIKAGLLTEWQSEILLEGRFRGFFLGKYKLLDHVGSGGMSTVYLAEHQVMRRRVAIKVLPKHRVNDSSYLARFHQEARAAASLDDPHVVRAFDVDNDGDVHFLVMEYVDGPDVQNLVTRDGPMPFRTAADFTRQAATGLHHAHEMGLIHRDMKPANLLVDKSGVVKVLDLGLARFADENDSSLTIDHDEKVLGTVDYLAPEQALDSHTVDRRADIYGLGCTMYFMLTGSPPFPEGSMAQRVIKHQNAEPADIRLKRPDIPPALLAICQRMMAKKVTQRYQTCAEVSQALSDWLEGRVSSRPSAGSITPPAGGNTAAMHEDDLLLVDMDQNDPPSADSPNPASTRPAPDIAAVARQVVAKAAAGSGPGSGTAPGSSPAGSGKGPVAGPALRPPSGPGQAAGGKPPSSVGASVPRESSTPQGSGPRNLQQGQASTGQGSGKQVLGSQVPGSKGPGSTPGGSKANPAGTAGQQNPPAAGSKVGGSNAGGAGIQGKSLQRPGGLPVARPLPQQPPPSSSLVDDLLGEELGPGRPAVGGDLPSLTNLADLVDSAPPPITMRSGPHATTSKKQSSLPWDSTWFLIFIGLFMATAVLLLGWSVMKFL